MAKKSLNHHRFVGKERKGQKIKNSTVRVTGSTRVGQERRRRNDEGQGSNQDYIKVVDQAWSSGFPSLYSIWASPLRVLTEPKTNSDHLKREPGSQLISFK